MWKIWKEELYKMMSRKIIWFGFVLMLAFITFILTMRVKSDYSVVTEGKQTYLGMDAVKIDKEITRQYEGAVTKEKIMEIYDRYGFYYYDTEKEHFTGNYCSKFITENFTNYMQTSGQSLDEIQFLPEGELKERIAEYADNHVDFAYVYGWADMREAYGITAIWFVFVVLIIGLSPLFSEEYTLRTADILLTTRHGKNRVIWMKAAAAMFFAVISFTLVTLYIWGLYLMTFGTTGLEASPMLLGIGFWGYHTETLWGLFLMMFGLGTVGILLLTGIVMLISACCKNTFLTVVTALAVFLVPVVWLKVFSPMWPLGITLTKWVNHLMVSMPVYLPMNWGFSFTGDQILLHVVIALIVGPLCMIFGYRRFRNYQG